MRDRGRKSRGAPAVRGSMARHGNHTSSPSITRRTIDLSSLGTLPRARLLPIRYVYVCIARYIFQRRRPRAGIHSRSLKSVRCVVRIFFFFFYFRTISTPKIGHCPAETGIAYCFLKIMSLFITRRRQGLSRHFTARSYNGFGHLRESILAH